MRSDRKPVHDKVWDGTAKLEGQSDYKSPQLSTHLKFDNDEKARGRLKVSTSEEFRSYPPRK